MSDTQLGVYADAVVSKTIMDVLPAARFVAVNEVAAVIVMCVIGLFMSNVWDVAAADVLVTSGCRLV